MPLLEEHRSLLAAIAKEESQLSTREAQLEAFLRRPVKGGPDVSHWQKAINQELIASQGYEFIIYKTSEGLDLVDPWFSQARLEVTREVGMIPGYYHFARPQPGRTGTQEAKFALRTVKARGGLKAFDLPMTLDIEWSRGLSAKQIRSWCNDFHAVFREETGMGGFTYTGHFWNDNVKLEAPFSGRKLHNAHYTDAQAPRPIIGFDEWVIWQYTQEGVIRGINTLCDINRFNGKVSDLLGLLLK
jgi:lysozyme